MLRSVKMRRVMSQFGALDGHCETFDLYRIPRSAVSFKYFSRAFSSGGVRYYWPWAFSSFERRP
jgi:hypothetical protein